MADRMVTERLQPSLLDRLTDEEPTADRESRSKRVIDIERLRQIIRRDLAWLLNTTNMGAELDNERYPNVAKSTVNYGLTPMAGHTKIAEKSAEIRKSIVRAIENFEPRIIRGTTQVQLSEGEDEHSMNIALDIRSDMWAQPMPLELFLRSRVDLTTGEVELDRSV